METALSPDDIILIYNHLDELEKQFTKPHSRQNFFARFPSECFFDINVIANESFSKCLDMIAFLSKYEEFYSSIGWFESSYEFILTSLTALEKDCAELGKILHMLTKFFSKMWGTWDFNPERILEILLDTLRKDYFNYTNPEYYFEILKFIVDCNGSKALENKDIILELFSKLEKKNNIKQLCQFCRLMIEWNLLQISLYPEVHRWIRDSISHLESQIENLDVIQELLDFLIYLITDQNYKNITDYEEIYGRLLKQSGQLCYLTNYKDLKEQCYKLLEISYRHFSKLESIPTERIDFFTEFSTLPDKVSDWPKVDNYWTICLYFMVHKNSRFLWKNIDVIKAMCRCYYSKQDLISGHVLKSIYYLYPELMSGSVVRDFENDILQSITLYCSVSYLFTISFEQFKWVFKEGEQHVKEILLRYWLERFEDNKKLIKLIKVCKGQEILLKIYLEDMRLQHSLRAREIILQMKDNNLSTQISQMLILTVNNFDCFKWLLLSGPNVPAQQQDVVMLCGLMSVMIPKFEDYEILKAACRYTKELLYYTKDNADSIKSFCRNPNNITVLLEKISTIQDCAAIELLKLFKTLVKIQTGNDLNVDLKVESNFFPILNSNNYKVIENVLKLIDSILCCNNCFLIIHKKYIVKIFHKIWSLTFKNKHLDIYYKTIITFLKKETWLCTSIGLVHCIEVKCRSLEISRYNDCFVQVLYDWLKILVGKKENCFLKIPKETIETFVRRNSVNSKGYLILGLLGQIKIL